MHAVVIGIDPGRESALAAVSIAAHPQCIMTTRYRVGKPRKSEPPTPTDSLRDFVAALSKLGWYPKVAVIEDQFVQKNWKSAIALAQTAGRWQEACSVCAIPFIKAEPAQWQATTVIAFKKAFGIPGRLNSQMAKDISVKVAKAVGVKGRVTQDESDAVCIAVHVARKMFSRQ